MKSSNYKGWAMEESVNSPNDSQPAKNLQNIEKLK